MHHLRKHYNVKGAISILSPKKMIVMHAMGLKNLCDTLPKVFGLVTYVQPYGVKKRKGLMLHVEH